MSDSTDRRRGAGVIRLSPPDLHVWSIALDRPGGDESVLSADERERAARFRFDRDRTRFVRARTALRRLLAAYTGIAAERLTFAVNAFGKPRLTEAGAVADLEFNLSHAGDIALAALARGRAVGIDVEVVRSEAVFFPVGYGSPAELRALATGTDRAFFRWWTRKEAVVKALGRGLSFRLDSFDVSLEAESRPTVTGPPEVAGLRLFDLDVGAAYAAAVAVAGDARPARFAFPANPAQPVTER